MSIKKNNKIESYDPLKELPSLEEDQLSFDNEEYKILTKAQNKSTGPLQGQEEEDNDFDEQSF